MLAGSPSDFLPKGKRFVGGANIQRGKITQDGLVCQGPGTEGPS